MTWIAIVATATVGAFSYLRAPHAADKTGPAGAHGTAARPTPSRSAGGASPYWRLERRYWQLERQAGRLGDQIRRLRAEKHGLRRAVTVLRVETAAHAKRVRTLLLNDPSVEEAINLAAAVYGYGDTLWRKARCETGGSMNPRAYNSSGASGLFQFLPSTWASTPFAGFSVWSPYANAMAAGWMHAHGRGGEWVCQ